MSNERRVTSNEERKKRLEDEGIRFYVMLNLFQHLTASLYLPPLLGEILKQVQDDVIVSIER